MSTLLLEWTLGGLPAFAAVTRAVCPGGGTELFCSGRSSQILPPLVTLGGRSQSGTAAAQTLLLLFSRQVTSYCNLMDCRTPGPSVLHYLLEFAQIHVRGVGVTI